MNATEPAGRAARVWGARRAVVLAPGSSVGVLDGVWGGSLGPEKGGSILTAADFGCSAPVLEQNSCLISQDFKG